ncbi:MAG: hypothetical protein Q4C41_03645 [Eggerthellaceae bacterium]|nr:hypothetical protein [Eggerthellaceae bacterium]
MGEHSRNRFRQFCLSELEVDRSDVTTVSEALRACEARLLLPLVMRAEAGWRVSPDALDGACRKTLLRKIEAALSLMGSLSPSGGAHAEDVIVPWERFEVCDANGVLLRRVGAAVLDEGDAASMRLLLHGGARRVADLACLDVAAKRFAPAGEGDAWRWRNLAQSLVPLAFEPWEETLARRIWLPRSLCEKERYYVLGSVFWAMTYLGFNAASRVRVKEGSHAGRFSERFVERSAEGFASPCGGKGAYAFSPEAPLGSALPSDAGARFDADYLHRLMRAAQLLNYNSWIDLLEAFTALVPLDQAA